VRPYLMAVTVSKCIFIMFGALGSGAQSQLYSIASTLASSALMAMVTYAWFRTCSDPTTAFPASRHVVNR
jgi:hypothetical protein